MLFLLCLFGIIVDVIKRVNVFIFNIFIFNIIIYIFRKSFLWSQDVMYSIPIVNDLKQPNFICFLIFHSWDEKVLDKTFHVDFLSPNINVVLIIWKIYFS